MPASRRRYWERRAERQFAKWDAIEDPYGLPEKEFRRAIASVNEASTICMVLDACDKERKK